MSDKNIKLIRKQIRNVVQELLPEIMKKEVFVESYDRVQKEVASRLTFIEGQVKNSLKEMDDRSKDMQGFVMRQVLASTAPQPVVTEESGDNTEAVSESK